MKAYATHGSIAVELVCPNHLSKPSAAHLKIHAPILLPFQPGSTNYTIKDSIYLLSEEKVSKLTSVNMSPTTSILLVQFLFSSFFIVIC